LFDGAIELEPTVNTEVNCVQPSEVETLLPQQLPSVQVAPTESPNAPIPRIHENRKKQINEDAAKLKHGIDNTMVFYCCCVCQHETGLENLVLRNKYEALINASALPSMYCKLIQQRDNQAASIYARKFASVAFEELLPDGTLPMTKYLCKSCLQGLKPGKGRNPTHALTPPIPPLALVNGHFKGRCPVELSTLNNTELSLICLINVITKLSLLLNTNHGNGGTLFSVINDLSVLVPSLPRNPSIDDFALLRSASDTSTSPTHRYSPYKVLKALKWLSTNNHLYEGKVIIPVDDEHWQGDGAIDPLDLEYITIDEEFAVEEIDVAVGIDGHAANPGAAPTGASDILLIPGENTEDIMTQVRNILTPDESSNVPRVLTRATGIVASMHKTNFFIQRAFPYLYPYGRGGPEEGGFKFNAIYIKHVLELGLDRSFQQCPNFIFYSYRWVMRKGCGQIAFLGSRNSSAEVENDLTVETAQAFLRYAKTAAPNDVQLLSHAKMRLLMNKLQPFASEIPGTDLFFQRERKQLMSIISSAVTTSIGSWDLFATTSMNDTYLPEFYDNVVTSVRSSYLQNWSNVEDRMRASDVLTWSERCQLLRDHPYLAARLFDLQLTLFIKHILYGKHEPYGTILDHWIRIEFQAKGTAHAHMLCNSKRNPLLPISAEMDMENQEVVRCVKNTCGARSTAILQSRREDDLSDMPADPDEQQYLREEERKWDYTIDRKKYFIDCCSSHPCRQRFKAGALDYSMDPLTGIIGDPAVQTQYRRLQLHNQIHTCSGSCYKYCKRGVHECRYGYPRQPDSENENCCVIIKERDRRCRMTVKVRPKRNNANMNPTAISPLIPLFTRGNVDNQYIIQSAGAVEYSCKYTSKNEQADSTVMQNTVSRSLAKAILRLPPHEAVDVGMKLRAVSTALIEGQQVGAVHACYILSKQKLVRSSRAVDTVNSLARKDITGQAVIIDEGILESMENNASAFSDSPSTQLGKRKAFHIFSSTQKQLYGVAKFDYYSFLSSYRTTKDNPASRGTATKIVDGVNLHQILVDEEGFMTNAKTCFINGVLYTARYKLAVLQLVPFIPVSEDTERSAYSLLLMHSNWGESGEESILGCSDCAVNRLNDIRETLPPHVKRSLDFRNLSEEYAANTGEPPAVISDVTAADFDEFAGDDDSETEEGAATNVYGNDETIVPESTIASNRFITKTPRSQMAFLNNFIDNERAKNNERSTSSNSLNTNERELLICDPQTHFPINNLTEEQTKLGKMIDQCNERQADVVETARPYLEGRDKNQMLMILSGEGGTGKSHCIHLLTLMTRIVHGKTEGRFGSVVKCAPTGGAAFNINGHTWHSACGKGNISKFKVGTVLKSPKLNKLRRDFKGAVLFILDEMSLASLEDLNEISTRLSFAMDNDKPFGALHVILAGDFYQMKTMTGMPLFQAFEKYTKSHQEMFPEAAGGRHIMLSCITHFRMLTYNVRASSTNGDPSPLADIVSKIRVGNDDVGVLEAINVRIVSSINQAIAAADPLAVWIAPTHKDIAMINKVFSTHMVSKGGTELRMIANHIPKNTSIPAPDEAMRNLLYAEAGDIKGGNTYSTAAVTHMDLQIGSRVRLTKNICVEMGLFNGAMGTVYSFVYSGEGPASDMRKPTNFSRLEYTERELPIILVRMDGIDNISDPSKSTFRYSCSNSVTRLIPIAPIVGQKAIKTNYHRVQYPLAVAHARTAQSMQGYTAHHGVVVATGSMFFAGDYVAISRAKSLEQVWLLHPLLSKNVTSHPTFRVSIEVEYARLCALPHHPS
jgi:hypothetical protein